MLPVTGPDRIECYEITHESGASAMVARHGGHVLSWKTADGVERLFLSEKAEYKTGKAIRGGVPVIFPQFSDHGPYARHGFARKLEWKPARESDELILSSSEETLADWPFNFEISLKIALSPESLQLTLQVHNTGSDSFPFQSALHTYFRSGNSEQTKVSGLAGLPFLNEVTKESESDDSVCIVPGEEIDRSYIGAGRSIVRLQTDEGVLQIQSKGFVDIVVWNPGPEHGIGDLTTNGWKEFFCIESGLIQNGPILKPGEKWAGSQKITVS